MKERSGGEFRAEFMRTINHPNGANVDMYMLRDDPLGRRMVTLGVPHGDRELAYRIARLLNAEPTPS